MQISRAILSSLLLLLCTATACHAFAVAPATVRASSLQMTVLTYGSKKKNFKPGTPLSKAVAQLGVKPRYSCKKGDCATCEIFLAGRMTKPCVAKVPPEPRLKSLQEKGLEIRM
mmetsp:Transcript_4883/g.12867  ORF Transcript_4883/g.12867 Transcript_4883/m.12867 type:complete len:114 (-) Transcript_4883:1920-2261(-)